MTDKKQNLKHNLKNKLKQMRQQKANLKLKPQPKIKPKSDQVKISKLNIELPVKSHNVPVTNGMFDLYRGEINSSITSMHLDIKGFKKEVSTSFQQVHARFQQVDARFQQVDARFQQVDARFQQVDARFEKLEMKMDSQFAALTSQIHRLALIVEEQGAKNNIVLDAISAITNRQFRFEEQIDEHVKNIEQVISRLKTY